MPSQSKEYAKQNTKYAISINRVLNQNTKYAISIKRIRQPKHQIPITKYQKNTPMWTLFPNMDLRCFFVRQLLLWIYALFGVQFEVLEIALAYKKWQITGMCLDQKATTAEPWKYALYYSWFSFKALQSSIYFCKCLWMVFIIFLKISHCQCLVIKKWLLSIHWPLDVIYFYDQWSLMIMIVIELSLLIRIISSH